MPDHAASDGHHDSARPMSVTERFKFLRRSADTTGMTQLLTTHPVMTALAAGVPLSLLADLANPAGPDSRGIYDTETADLSWLQDLVFPATSGSARLHATG